MKDDNLQSWAVGELAIEKTSNTSMRDSFYSEKEKERQQRISYGMEVLSTCFRVHSLQKKYFTKWAASVKHRSLMRKAAPEISRLETELQALDSANSQMKDQNEALQNQVNDLRAERDLVSKRVELLAISLEAEHSEKREAQAKIGHVREGNKLLASQNILIKAESEHLRKAAGKADQLEVDLETEQATNKRLKEANELLAVEDLLLKAESEHLREVAGEMERKLFKSEAEAKTAQEALRKVIEEDYLREINHTRKIENLQKQAEEFPLSSHHIANAVFQLEAFVRSNASRNSISQHLEDVLHAKTLLNKANAALQVKESSSAIREANEQHEAEKQTFQALETDAAEDRDLEKWADTGSDDASDLTDLDAELEAEASRLANLSPCFRVWLPYHPNSRLLEAKDSMEKHLIIKSKQTKLMAIQAFHVPEDPRGHKDTAEAFETPVQNKMKFKESDGDRAWIQLDQTEREEGLKDADDCLNQQHGGGWTSIPVPENPNPLQITLCRKPSLFIKPLGMEDVFENLDKIPSWQPTWRPETECKSTLQTGLESKGPELSFNFGNNPRTDMAASGEYSRDGSSTDEVKELNLQLEDRNVANTLLNKANAALQVEESSSAIREANEQHEAEKQTFQALEADAARAQDLGKWAGTDLDEASNLTDLDAELEAKASRLANLSPCFRVWLPYHPNSRLLEAKDSMEKHLIIKSKQTKLMAIQPSHVPGEPRGHKDTAEAFETPVQKEVNLEEYDDERALEYLDQTEREARRTAELAPCFRKWLPYNPDQRLLESKAQMETHIFDKRIKIFHQDVMTRLNSMKYK